MDKNKLFIWSLYDFANSIVMIAFFLYFSQWLVINQGISDFWFNLTLTVSSLLLLATGPVAGAIADKTGIKMPGLRLTTYGSFLFYFLTGVIAISYPHQVILAIITFTLGSYFYLFSFVFYNSFLNVIAPQDMHGRASGWGQFGNYSGQIVAIFITLPFATGILKLWGAPGRAQAFIPATVLFLLFSLPMLFLFRERDNFEIACVKKEEVKPEIKPKINIKQEYKNMWQSFVNLCKVPGLGRFFLAYFFFNDAVITASNNFPIYLDKVFGVSDTVKSLLLIGILLASAIGAPVSGWIADNIGLKKTLIGILIGWVIIFPVMALSENFTFFIFVSVLMGFWFGAVWTVTRAIVTRFSPHHVLNQSFSYYTLMERFATFIGPLSWGLIVALLPHRYGLNYRVAAFSMAVFVALGLFIARKIPA